MHKPKGQIISITGDLGSGKSSVARLLAEKLGWQYYSTGMAQRKIAEELQITTVELNLRASSDSSIDKKIDSVFKNLPWGDEPCVVDSRLAFYFLPDSFRVYLSVDADVAAERIFHDMKRKSEKQYQTVEQAKKACAQRRSLEIERFMNSYQLDITNPHNFDLIIDTTKLSLEQVCNKIVSQLPFKTT